MFEIQIGILNFGHKNINSRFHLCYVSSHSVSYINIFMYLAAVQDSFPDSNIGLDRHLFQQSHRLIKAACSTQKTNALQSVLCRKELPSRQNISEPPPQDRCGYMPIKPQLASDHRVPDVDTRLTNLPENYLRLAEVSGVRICTKIDKAT